MNARIEAESWAAPYTENAPHDMKKAGKIFRHSPARTSAFVVRRHYLQTTLEFALRTMRLLGVKLEIQFFSDEPPAWAWLDERRKDT